MALILEGQYYRLEVRPDSVAQVERHFARGIMALAHELAEGILTLEQLAVIVEASITPPYRGKPLPQALLECGLGEAGEAVAGFFLAALQGRQEIQVGEEALAEMMQAFPD
jgi:hypothetical protein